MRRSQFFSKRDSEVPGLSFSLKTIFLEESEAIKFWNSDVMEVHMDVKPNLLFSDAGIASFEEVFVGSDLQQEAIVWCWGPCMAMCCIMGQFCIWQPVGIEQPGIAWLYAAIGEQTNVAATKNAAKPLMVICALSIKYRWYVAQSQNSAPQANSLQSLNQ